MDLYTAKVNELISLRIYAPIKAKADERLNAGYHTRARVEIEKLEEVYKWFCLNEKKPTQAGKDHTAYLLKISRALEEAFLEGKMKTDQAFRDLKRRDEAYLMLDAAVDSGTVDQRMDLEKTREKYLREDVASADPALDRIKLLKSIHVKNQAATIFLNELEKQFKIDAQQVVGSTAAKSATFYAAFRPKFDEALNRRDLAVARNLLHDIYFGTGSHQATFLPASTDTAILKGYLDPARIEAADTRKITELAEAGIKFTDLRTSQYPLARELYMDLRIAALLEELLEQALEGSRVASRDATKFKTGYTAALKEATAAEPASRKTGEGLALLVTMGAAKTAISLSPAGGRSLPEDDIVALARRAPTAAADPAFALKAFYLHLFAGRLPAAREWLEKITTPEGRLGTERYADRFKGMISTREEEEARKLFGEAWDLYHKKHDAVGGALKFKECLTRYSDTEYMKAKVPPGNRTRIEIVRDFFGASRIKK
jgi:hypothetical protein